MNMRLLQLVCDSLEISMPIYTENALYKLTSCGRVHARISTWTNFDLSMACFERAGVEACERAG